MYPRLLRLYKAGRLTASGINNAVTLGWITAEQAAEIMEAA